MNNNEDFIMTEEELDNVVGGENRTYYYELKTNKKGSYYRCLIYKDGVNTGKTNIPANRWEEFLKILADNKDSALPLSEL